MKNLYTSGNLFPYYLLFVLSLVSFSATSQGTGCATATAVSINGNCLSGTINDTSQDAPNYGTCAGAFQREGWYTFTVTTGSTPINIVATSGNRNLALQLISSTAACTGLTQINCANADTTNNSAQTESISTTLGNGIYYIKVLNVGGNNNMNLTGLCVSSYCLSNTSAATTEYISNFTTTGGSANINNTSTFSTGGFGNFTAQAVSQTAGQAINFSSTYVGGTFGFAIWVDWNNDLDFADAGEAVYSSGGYNSSHTGSFTVPAATPVGNYRMRIRANYYSTTPAACGTITDGETEDYTLTVTTPPACNTYPSGLTTTAVASTTATISWAAASPAPASGYEYYVSASATAPTAGTTPTGSTGAGVTSAPLSGLTSNTTYYFWVRANCNGVDKGNWVGSGSFYTGYCISTSSATTYYINNFTTTGGVTNVANATGYATGGYGNYTAQTVTQYAGQTVNFSSAYTGGTFGFAIWIDWNNDLDFNDTGETVYNSGSYNNANTGSFTVPGGTPAGNYRMRIRADYLATSPAACGNIADGETEDYTFTVPTPPVCSSLPSGLTATPTSTTTATISWTAASPAPGSGYEYYVSASATTPTAGTTPTGSVGAGITTASLTGLTPSTTYYFWVRSNCNGVDKGLWIGSGTFFTGYCVSTTSSGTTYYINKFMTTGGLSNINNTTGFSTGGYGNYTVQAVSQYASQNISFSSAYTGGTFGFAIWVDWNNDLDFNDAGENVYISGTYNTSDSGTFTVPGGTPAGNYRMRIRADYFATSPFACGAITNGETEDYTLTVATPLACGTYPSALTTTALTATTATLSWTAAVPAPANGYEYYVSTSAAAPTAGTTPSGTVAAGITSANLTGLTANATYYFWVRCNCDGVNKGLWIGTGTFYTGYCTSTSTSPTYYIRNFSTTGGSPNISNLNSGYSASGYGNFTAQVVSQLAGGNIAFSADFYDGFYTYGCNVWVDWNNDLDFTDPGELVYASSGYYASVSGTFNVPSGTTPGNYRMRIRADYYSTNPAACGSISYGETEDYTVNVANPLPCAGNPTNVSASIASSNAVTVSWADAVPSPANGYQYYISTSATAPTAGTTPSGSVGAGLLSATITPLTAGTTYYFWIRSNCGGALGQGFWIGPLQFRIPTCGVGNSTGTANNLICPSTIAGGLGLNGAPPPAISCASGGCTTLEATYPILGDTSSYTVSSIPYAPPYQFNCLKNPVSVNDDDVWSPVINLPFNFCFYGTPNNQCLMSSNGVITFDMVNNTPGGYSGWSFANNLPSSSLFMNSIFGVYQDIDPRVGGEVGWELITLDTGCRALVAAWSNIPMYSTTCNSQLFTGMIVLYENTNVIDVYIKEKNVCASWNDGNAIVGLQNATASNAVVAPGRNGLDADWTATNEAWRFTPSGPSISSVKWYAGSSPSGPVIGTSNTLFICPTATTDYTAEVSYLLCNGSKLKEHGTTTVTVTPSKTWNGSVSTNWDTAANWTPAGVPTASDCVIIPDVTNDPVISGSGYNAYAYSVYILDNGFLTLNSANNLTITNALSIDPAGRCDIKNAGSLVQINSVPNIGSVNMERTTPPLYRFDYEYWNSPMTAASNYTLGMLSQNLTQPDKYYHWIPSVGGGVGNWAQESAATVMDPSRGYIVRAPNTFSFTPTVFTPYTATFVGTPNNGSVSCPISYGTMGAGTLNDKYNLIGNPYPCAVDAFSFTAANASTITGTLYYWTHNSAISALFADPFYGDFVYNYTAADYAAWNSTGGTAATTGGSAPGDYIPAGQSFMAVATTNPGNATFTNNMRTTGHNTLFFRPSPNPHFSPADNQGEGPFERHRIWLNLTNTTSAFSQTLVGYVENATSGFDNLFDGRSMNEGQISFYSLIPDEKLVIQGRPLPFDVNDQVPLGYRSAVSGDFSIRIDHFDDFFDAHNIYVEDHELNIIHDLKLSPYNFAVTPGTVDDRFTLRFTDGTALGIGHPAIDTGMTAFIRDGKIHIAANSLMERIAVYDISGKFVRAYNVSGSFEFTGDFPYANGVYLAKVRLSDGTVANKKLIN